MTAYVALLSGLSFRTKDYVNTRGDIITVTKKVRLRHRGVVCTYVQVNRIFTRFLSLSFFIFFFFHALTELGKTHINTTSFDTLLCCTRQCRLIKIKKKKNCVKTQRIIFNKYSVCRTVLHARFIRSDVTFETILRLRIGGTNVLFLLRYFHLRYWIFVEYSAVFRNIKFNEHENGKYFHSYTTAISYIIVNIYT